MGEYQYYEFCKINAPLTADARKEMYSLSSRAKITTHGASYVYNYGNFLGNPKNLLLKYFDVFFYISKWGCIQLMFKYSIQEINANVLKEYCANQIINCIIHDSHILLDINFNNEDGFGWVEGEGILPDLLPIYEEIKSGDYQFLQLVANIDNENINSSVKNHNFVLSQAQEAFFKYAEVDLEAFYT
jgi:hypothetical protein